MESAVIDRALEVPVVHNVRSLQGLRLIAGGHTRVPDILRGGGLNGLTEDGVRVLANAGIRTIVDLRSSDERTKMATPDLSDVNITVVHAPVFETDTSPTGQATDPLDGFPLVYQRMLTNGMPAFRAVAESVAENDGGVYFHCAVGKDRTGLAAALLLATSGVDEDEIVADYALSEAGLAAVTEKWIANMIERGTSEVRARGLMTALAPDMRATLDFINATWGSAEGYLRATGVSDASMSAIRARIVG